MATAVAQDLLDTEALRKSFRTIEQQLAAGNVLAEDVAPLVLSTSESRQQINLCIQVVELKLEGLREDRTVLDLEGGTEGGLSRISKAELDNLDSAIESQKSRVVECQLLSNRVDDVLKKLAAYKGSLLINRLQYRSRSGVDVLEVLLADRSNLLSITKKTVASIATKVRSTLSQSYVWAAVGLVALVFGVYLSFFSGAYRNALVARNGNGSVQCFLLSFYVSVLRSAYLLLPLSAISLRWLMLGQTASSQVGWIHSISYFLTIYLWLVVFVRALLQPENRQWLFVPVQPERCHALAQRFQVLLLVVFLFHGLQLTVANFDVPDSLAHAMRLFVVTALVSNLMWLIWLVDGLQSSPGRGRALRTGLVFILLIALCAELFGYLNLSVFMLTGFIGTMLAIALLWLLSEFTREVFDGLDAGKRSWQRKIRQRLAIEDGKHVPGLLWFRLIALVSVWTAATMVFLQSWELSEISWAFATKVFNDGFLIGEFRLVPAKILLGVVLFATVLLLSDAVKSSLKDNPAILSRLEPSAKETVVTLTGYTGFIIALFIGLSLAGFSFQNLAIVAGALSVGVGFGLQNIVNNFVSGIILLFERPIRRGDWVVVGGTEGFVKNIRVRSTEIETFDRSDVVVPNSEFISQQVTNWTLSDPNGRVKVPVGVARGTDPETVRDILLAIANDHSQVLEGGRFQRVPEPSVLFIGFGDSSLDFELRCFIRDIRQWPTVRSDLNFAIDREFGKHNIEIPNPQRDVHMIAPPSDEEEL